MSRFIDGVIKNREMLATFDALNPKKGE